VSGFGGIVRVEHQQPLLDDDASCIARMAAAVPGSTSIRRFFPEGAGFWFQFLRTGPAPQAATQPVSLDEKTWLIGDLRLDGRHDLIARLRASGEECDGRSTDEELVLRAWRCWALSGSREKFDEALRGEFSFALWQPAERRTTFFRDLMGARPFFYSAYGGLFYFSNRLEAFCIVPQIINGLDEYFLGDYLLNGWCAYPERTVFRNIRRLAPGHAAEFSRAGLKIRRFASLPLEEPLLRKRDEEYVEEYLALLRLAVQERLPDDHAVVLMSGGLDSTTVAATAAALARASTKRVALQAYTVDLQPLFDDPESRWAEVAAKHIGIPQYVRHDGDQVPFAALETLALRLPEPRHEPYLSSLFEQYRQASEYGSVALTGDGGDDILLGNAWPYLLDLLKRGRLGRLATAFLGYFLQKGKLPPIRAGIRTRLRQWLRLRSGTTRYPGWLNPEFETSVGLRDRWEELRREPGSGHPLHARAYAMLSGPFWPVVLESEEFFCGESAMQTRAPLMDTRMLRFLLRIPPIPWCADKELVRRAMKTLLPESIRRRPKSPVPVDTLQLQLSQGKWSPMPAAPTSGLLSNYVDPKKWIAALQADGGACDWMNHSPLSLDAWLKGVEKRGWIE
jgi:asparagine synthase (glutamine-hydrolysing)